MFPIPFKAPVQQNSNSFILNSEETDNSLEEIVSSIESMGSVPKVFLTASN
jgi:hypothetical protein